MKVLVGTSNINKVQNIKEFINNKDIQLITPDMLDNNLKIDESGNTPVENAKIKALAYYNETKMPVISYDSGLYFLDIDKNDKRQPGLYVRIVNGKELSDDEMIEYYKKEADEFGGRIKATYLNGYCIVKDEDTIYEFIDEDPKTIDAYSFYIVNKPHAKRTPGWPLDSLSVEESTGKYFVETDSRDDDDNKKEKRELRDKRLQEFYDKAFGNF